ncbi:hypothetical protein PHMEG_0005309 [Phytophthora megakarya]|uniref:Uncharacterized protein n=1 Tax=Phytophthora megakarya TaxID=4795 RepID=A0A225WRL1_9STRA|nr:hypothetical protein PHMEG_0005309 [Phytophthora megakarya]
MILPFFRLQAIHTIRGSYVMMQCLDDKNDDIQDDEEMLVYLSGHALASVSRCHLLQEGYKLNTAATKEHYTSSMVAQELPQVTIVEEVVEAFEIRNIKSPYTSRAKSQNYKFRELQAIGKQIGEIGCQWGITPR